MITRRGFVGMVGLAAAGAASCAPVAVAQRAASPAQAVLRPRRLSAGDTVGLVSPGSPVAEPLTVQLAQESFEAMGLRVKLGRFARERRGYLAGRDEERAADLNAMFADRSVDAVFAPLKIPAWSGAMIGHITDQWTLPVGAEVEIDAGRGIIRMLEPAVT
jgi:muramoyltetrapeptide carboxypeptidase